MNNFYFKPKSKPFFFGMLARITSFMSIFGLLLLIIVVAIYCGQEAIEAMGFDLETLLYQNPCSIPQVPMYSTNYKYMVHNETIPDCKEELQISELQNGILKLYAGKENNTKCCIANILRPYELETDSYAWSDCADVDTESLTNVSQREYFVVECTKVNVSETNWPKREFHANFRMNGEIIRKTNHWEKHSQKPVNILLFVIDSTSKVDAHRKLPQTLKFLSEGLHFIEYNGYHTLGEPTMPNAIPLLMGIDYSEFVTKVKPHFESHWDEYPFIWKDFYLHNYVTSYIEDIPNIGTFNYGNQTGFKFQPTDIYTRPLMVAFDDTKHPNIYVKNMCFGKRNMAKFNLDYQFELLTKLRKVPTLFIPWFCWPHHNIFSTLSVLDDPYLEFFKKIATFNGGDILEDTVIIVMSDHAFKENEYAYSDEGMIERRLPLFMIRLPERLTAKFPMFLRNVKKNSQRLTSHFDTYKTLVHLLEIAGGVPSSTYPNVSRFGQSLLNLVPFNRTCFEAHIPEIYCACNLLSPINNNSLSQSQKSSQSR